jgi:hypothetical protein
MQQLLLGLQQMLKMSASNRHTNFNPMMHGLTDALKKTPGTLRAGVQPF